MLPEERDPAYLWDMLEAAREAQQFIVAVSLDQYLQHPILQRAIERLVEIIGEAARKVSDTFKTAHADIPWQAIVAPRHVLAHEYGRIDQHSIWLVATIHLPDLITKLTPLIPPLPPEVEG